ncbi:Glycosyltransferase, catalytic subunit of cellulose synthase and poly-beta-1,6-N-acetylglucosamine synthase [Noviherbaspirillum humi]|uniref:Glycosyltransferase, catalytic subunit of cellulose synthase and poly-beta-1,6-N-acetylglucosamine synthase n=1 Tax=Noviherbaspirillum humi TaxID=1688639 RepID=A0A239GW36_9BURK|nr:glycosyltransferase family 2 protein [Noviherbaspirillum humi]SNS73327.1 Glycosyltransferase, catalytic subunit of cellulose synthase and poly-beta-1,6-N-acetylglucosamine synthase [Noviherbaspirillum humi]
MVFFLELTFLAVAALVAVPVTMLLMQVLLAWRGERKGEQPGGERPAVAVLVPAHDEAASLGDTLDRLKAQLKAGDRLLVVADNCSDDTAGIAWRAGAEITERHDELRRGKGYALDHGVRILASDPRPVVIIVDADCTLESGAIDILAREAVASGRPVQGLYLMHAPDRERLSSRIAEFAWLVKNHVRPLGMRHAGLPCQLMGTGMAFPWSVISAAPLATGHLVEDMKLGLDLASRGTAPLFCPAARVHSEFPTSARGAEAQRSRWEHGHMGMIFGALPGALRRAVTTGNVELLMMALDLMVPPLALLCLACAALSLLGLGASLLSGAWLPFFAALAVMLLLGSALMLAWICFGRGIVSARDILFGMGYIAGKLPLYVRFFLRRQVEWIRTERR